MDIIQPFSKFIEVIFLKLYTMFNNYGISLILLSIIVNIVLFPFYNIAEKIEKKEKDIQNKMKPKIEEFKSVYEGYEQHLYIKAVYRMHDYHPIYSLRGLVSLLIQIPFFMGAFNYLSSYSGFDGISFLGINNLATPDNLIRLNSLSINVLPILMTFFNLWSGYIYTRDSESNEKITVIIIAIFFLIILYSSPASLLIYWTFNNIFSLVKNYLTMLKEKKYKIGG